MPVLFVLLVSFPTPIGLLVLENIGLPILIKITENLPLSFDFALPISFLVLHAISFHFHLLQPLDSRID